jgi:hypothetical protein
VNCGRADFSHVLGNKEKSVAYSPSMADQYEYPVDPWDVVIDDPDSARVYRMPLVWMQSMCGLFTMIWLVKLTVLNKSVHRTISIPLLLSMFFHTIHFAQMSMDPLAFRVKQWMYSTLIVMPMDKVR